MFIYWNRHGIHRRVRQRYHLRSDSFLWIKTLKMKKERRWDVGICSLNSGRWWRTEKPGVLQSMGSQRVGHDWATELNWHSQWSLEAWIFFTDFKESTNHSNLMQKQMWYPSLLLRQRWKVCVCVCVCVCVKDKQKCKTILDFSVILFMLIGNGLLLSF